MFHETIFPSTLDPFVASSFFLVTCVYQWFVLFYTSGTDDVKELMFKAAWSHVNKYSKNMDPTWLRTESSVTDPPKHPSIF